MIDTLLRYHCIPSFLKTAAIDWQLRDRLKSCESEEITHQKNTFINQLKQGPIAKAQDKANLQHYMQSTDFFSLVLGPRLKYSCCLYHMPGQTLAAAEDNMLDFYLEQLAIQPGQTILDLGCGWGSFSLYAAPQYPSTQFLALSNSSVQKAYIEHKAIKAGLTNLTVYCADITATQETFAVDKIISVEMFEHMRNYQALLTKLHQWLKPNGQLLVHYFCHKDRGYFFEDGWMADNFFTGGIMPSADTLSFFPDLFKVEKQQLFNGKQYGNTLKAWLDNHITHKKDIIKIFEQDTTTRNSHLHWEYWDLFFRACMQLFNFNKGNTWQVAVTSLKSV